MKGPLRAGTVQFSIDGPRLTLPLTVDVALVEDGFSRQLVPIATGEQVVPGAYQVVLGEAPIPAAMLNPEQWQVLPTSMRVRSFVQRRDKVVAVVSGDGPPVALEHVPSQTWVSICEGRNAK